MVKDTDMKDETPAFPRPFSEDYDPDISYPAHVGMSLRDYFAAKAMEITFNQKNSDLYTHVELAVEAYDIADAMLKARNYD